MYRHFSTAKLSFSSILYKSLINIFYSSCSFYNRTYLWDIIVLGK
ncbi:hypothetical protein EII33_04130 [Bacteroides heparinolyticus]|uniref:Uncharacterized protein n=1 Tax=Prevotella heparinolytica TaxID=28113 RepID=A0A3P2AAI5_9BACE|nr:hypothetical protein EII33_04130 [Bacteroides heparinolyticus]